MSFGLIKIIRTIINNHVSFFLSAKEKNKYPAVVQGQHENVNGRLKNVHHQLCQRYIKLRHCAVKKEHVLGVPFPTIFGYSNYESSMLLGCHDEYDTPSWLLGKKITGVLHQSTFKDMPLSLPTINVKG